MISNSAICWLMSYRVERYLGDWKPFLSISNVWFYILNLTPLGAGHPFLWKLCYHIALYSRCFLCPLKWCPDVHRILPSADVWQHRLQWHMASTWALCFTTESEMILIFLATFWAWHCLLVWVPFLPVCCTVSQWTCSIYKTWKLLILSWELFLSKIFFP